MFAATFNEFQNAQTIDATDRQESPEQEYASLIREATETLSNLPGDRGRQMRIALTSGWF
jgi:hypothetical protein